MIIRQAVLGDAAIISKLNDDYFHEESRDFTSIINSKESSMYLAIENDEVIGFTGMQTNTWNNTISVIDIFVHPDHRKKGIGHRLLNHLITSAKNTEYRCIIAEAPSLNSVLQLYLTSGFRICGYNDRYYGNDGGEVALFVALDL